LLGTSQIRTLLLSASDCLNPLPEAANLPSEEKATLATGTFCSTKQCNSCPLETSHRRTLPSQLPERARRPSGEKATARTSFVCPSKRRRSPAGSCPRVGMVNQATTPPTGLA